MGASDKPWRVGDATSRLLLDVAAGRPVAPPRPLNGYQTSQQHGCADGAVEWAWTHARVDPDHPLGPLWELLLEAYLAFLTTRAIFDHRFRLILFRDLVEVACGSVDWEAFDDFTCRWKLLGPAHLSLLIATRSLGAPIGEDELQTLRLGYLQLRWVERALARTDLVRFDGHRTHPVNLGIVTSHDRYADRLQLTATPPWASSGWRERVRGGLAARTRGGSVLNVVHVLPRDLARGAQTYARESILGRWLGPQDDIDLHQAQ